MATNSNCYDRLYENMKNRLTVIDNNSEYTVGDFMLNRAKIKKSRAMIAGEQNALTHKSEGGVATLISYVSDKLTIKNPPVKDKTIKAFPFRASFSALLSAVVACTFMLAFGLIGGKLLASGSTEGGSYSQSMIAESEIECDTETVSAQGSAK